MRWQIEIARDAKKELARLPPQVQKRIARAILALEDDPFPRGSKKLKNRDGWRVRIGDYRVLYFADEVSHRLVIGVIGHRRDVTGKLGEVGRGAGKPRAGVRCA